MQDPNSGLLCPVCVGGSLGLVPRQLVFKFQSPELSDGMDQGFTLGAQVGHLSQKVAGLAKSQTPRQLLS